MGKFKLVKNKSLILYTLIVILFMAHSYSLFEIFPFLSYALTSTRLDSLLRICLNYSLGQLWLSLSLIVRIKQQPFVVGPNRLEHTWLGFRIKSTSIPRNIEILTRIYIPSPLCLEQLFVSLTTLHLASQKWVFCFSVKKLILTSEWRAEHLFTGWNTQQVGCPSQPLPFVVWRY